MGAFPEKIPVFPRNAGKTQALSGEEKQALPVFPHRLRFSNFPRSGNLKKQLAGESLPLTPSALKNPKSILPEFLIFSLIFLHECPP